MAESSLRVAFIHPNMGLGGAERWVTDAAMALQQRGHRVTIWTAAFDPARCFEPLADGSLRLEIRAARLPGEIGGRLRAPCNLLRVAVLSWALATRREEYDVVITDLVAHALPLLRRRASLPMVFYCHFPDRLLTPPRAGLYAAYRRPIDRLEERGLAAADRVWVNSGFTAKKYAEAFPRLAAPRVLYPGVAGDTLEAVPDVSDEGPIRVLVLGRFEPAKNLELAIETLACLLPRLPAERAARMRLQLAGGLDRNRAEVRGLISRLRALASERGLSEQVELIENPSDRQRVELLSGCRCVLYTPSGEHFGLVPVEAMAAGRPVLAVNDGGPRETIVDGSTGKLRPPTAEAFAEALEEWILDVEAARCYGSAGRHRAQEFSQQRLGRNLERELLEVLSR